MNAKRNAHPTVGAVEQARAGNVLADGYSHDYCTSNPVTGQLKISDFLGTGRKNALTMRELRKFIDAGSRTIRLQIETERERIGKEQEHAVHGKMDVHLLIQLHEVVVLHHLQRQVDNG